jgi:hypothetical protein
VEGNHLLAADEIAAAVAARQNSSVSPLMTLATLSSASA